MRSRFGNVRDWRWRPSGASPGAAVRLQPASRAGDLASGADTTHRRAGADGVFEGRIRVMENRVAADPWRIFGRHRGGNPGEKDQAAKDAPGFFGDPGFTWRVAGGGCVVALGTANPNG